MLYQQGSGFVGKSYEKYVTRKASALRNVTSLDYMISKSNHFSVM